MQIPTLQTPRLTLVPPSAECEAVYQAFYTDAEASRMYGGPLTPAGAWNCLAADVGAWQLQGFGVWVLRRRAENDLVGACGFWQGKGWPRELTWWLLPEARGQGLAAEASAEVVRHAYVDLGWSKVETYMKDSNSAARSLVLRLGGVKTARQVFPDGLERDLFLLPTPAAA